MRHELLTLVLVLAPLQFCVAQQQAETPQKATVCQLLSDPKTWDHKLVQVTGFASHGFEDSAFFDPECDIHDRSLWMEFGGTHKTGTVSTASDSGRSRPKSAVVEGIKIPLVEDALFHHFDDLLHQGRGNLVHATVVARVFSGNSGVNSPLGGYGHLGCCSLFMIQQVLAVDDQRDPDLDYDGQGPYPDWKDVKCFAGIADNADEKAALKGQQLADQGQKAYAFDDPDRVAKEFVSAKAEADLALLKFKLTSATPARRVYQFTVSGSKKPYMVALNRPYLLSFYASNKDRVIWVVMSAYTSCD